MSQAEDRSALLNALTAWKRQDLDAVLINMAEDILYLVNVDGIQVPYAMSAVGKEDLRGRLELVLATFETETYNIGKIVHDTDHSRALAHGIYRHRATGEILDIHLRFCAWFENGLLIRVHELHDAAYIEAFERFVTHLAEAVHLAEQD